MQSWAYGETWDNWQDTFGLDAVNAVYHSGHGYMFPDGRFAASMGAAWENDEYAYSSQMKIGNEQANYVFWSTCLSLRVKDGHTPRRTWAGSNLGFRMMFGFETTSVDSPDYGRFFWEEWVKGKSLSAAWMDASWRINTGQEPAVVACGATDAEANHRLWNERFLDWNHVGSAFWRWRWYDKSTSWFPFRVADLPATPLVADLRPADPGAELRGLAAGPWVGEALPEDAEQAHNGAVGVRVGDAVLGTGPGSVRTLRLGELASGSGRPLASERAVEIARAVATEHGLDQYDLVLDGVGQIMEGGGTARGSGTLDPPTVAGTVVALRQRINGVPVIMPGQGEVRVTIGNDGRPVDLMVSTREVDRLTDRPRRTAVVPSTAGSPARLPLGDPDALLSGEQERLLADLTAARARSNGAAPPDLVVRETEEGTRIGYEIVGNEAFLAARRNLEIGPEDGPRKIYPVTVALYH